MSCTAYPNDSVATSGSTGTAPTAPPIRPVIATASASGSPPDDHDAATVHRTVTPTGPYELYCPGSPVGDLVLNDTTTTATITPSTLAQGQQFQLDRTSRPSSRSPRAWSSRPKGSGSTQITGDLSMFMDTTGVDDNVRRDPGRSRSSATGERRLASVADDDIRHHEPHRHRDPITAGTARPSRSRAVPRVLRHALQRHSAQPSSRHRGPVRRRTPRRTSSAGFTAAGGPIRSPSTRST